MKSPALMARARSYSTRLRSPELLRTGDVRIEGIDVDAVQPGLQVVSLVRVTRTRLSTSALHWRECGEGVGRVRELVAHLVEVPFGPLRFGNRFAQDRAPP